MHGPLNHVRSLVAVSTQGPSNRDAVIQYVTGNASAVFYILLLVFFGSRMLPLLFVNKSQYNKLNTILHLRVDWKPLDSSAQQADLITLTDLLLFIV